MVRPNDFLAIQSSQEILKVKPDMTVFDPHLQIEQVNEIVEDEICRWES